MSDREASNRRRFDELVLWYINGSITQEDRTWVDDYLSRHPEARHELQWHRELKSAFSMQDIPIPKGIGLNGLLNRVGKDDAQARLGFFDRIQSYLTGANLRTAFALGVVLVLAQALGLGLLVNEIKDQQAIIEGYSETRAVQARSQADFALLHVTFKSNASEREIRMLLVQIQGRIVDGPGQLGDYTVAVTADNAAEATATLAASPIVEVASSPERRKSGG